MIQFLVSKITDLQTMLKHIYVGHETSVEQNTLLIKRFLYTKIQRSLNLNASTNQVITKCKNPPPQYIHLKTWRRQCYPSTTTHYTFNPLFNMGCVCRARVDGVSTTDDGLIRTRLNSPV